MSRTQLDRMLGRNATMGPGRRREETEVKVGDKAPDFEALDQHGNTLVLRELLELGPVVVYFYARAMTRG